MTSQPRAGSGRTFAAALSEQVSRAPGEPLVTFYDDATGERVELSYTTFANWVAKTGSLVQDELGLGRGDLVAVDLPTHWLAPVWLGAAWSVGLTVGDASAADRADLVVCGPAGLETYAGGPELVACSLLPMGARFRDPLPAGVIDFGEVVWSQPDQLVVVDPPAAGDVAWVDPEGELDQGALLGLPADRQRQVTTVAPASRPGIALLVGPLLAGAGTVWVAGDPDPARLSDIAASERAEVEPEW